MSDEFEVLKQQIDAWLDEQDYKRLKDRGELNEDGTYSGTTPPDYWRNPEAYDPI